ncbi:MAG: beta-propeller fold lactonase family protein [Anaerolineae bacterium]|nr:beta-propeller fold lactonase family protein [Chloroflexota bacterium]MBP6297986.1 beta-propeller fold lactonase family protein [Anaerolineae bacterium]
MSQRSLTKGLPVFFAGLGVLLLIIAPKIGLLSSDAAKAQSVTRFAGPTKSGPLALNADDTLLAVANPDANTVSLFDVGGDRNLPLGEIAVGQEPNGVVVSPDGKTVYVANTLDGTVSVLTVDQAQQPVATVIATLVVGTEPYGIALTPNGQKAYVTNARSNSVSVIDTASNTVIKTITNIGPSVGAEPRGIAITNNGNDSDTDETVYITHFYSFANQGKLDGQDDSKTGLVTKISSETDSGIGQIVLTNMPDTGFKSVGEAIARIEPGQEAKFVTGAYPNQMQAIAIKNNFAYLPNVGASPNGPVAFNVSTQSLVHILDTTTNLDTGLTINLHKAVALQPEGPRKLFLAVPWAIAFKNNQNEGYVVSAASNVLVKITADPTTGALTVINNPLDGSVLEIPVGRNPRGIVINNADTRAYVMNYISRDVTVLDLTRFPEQVNATLRSTALPAAGSNEELVLVGEELYNTSVGEFTNSIGNMSREGWQSCAACHPFGLSDNVVWIFATGPRRTISQHIDFTGGTLRALNWSGIFDEEQDFELNIRGVSGGAGLLLKADGSALEETPNIGGLVIGDPAALAVHNSTRLELQARTPSGGVVPAWTAMVAYIQTIRAPISPLRGSTDPEIAEGRQIFINNNCQVCHGGPRWSSSSIPGPVTDLTQIAGGQIVAQLRNVGTFNPADVNEVRANAKPPLGEAGFVPPSLLSVFAVPPFFHNGGAASLDDALSDRFATHRAAGTGGIDGLSSPEDRRKLIKFLLSIDATTEPIQ